MSPTGPIRPGHAIPSSSSLLTGRVRAQEDTHALPAPTCSIRVDTPASYLSLQHPGCPGGLSPGTAHRSPGAQAEPSPEPSPGHSSDQQGGQPAGAGAGRASTAPHRPLVARAAEAPSGSQFPLGHFRLPAARLLPTAPTRSPREPLQKPRGCPSAGRDSPRTIHAPPDPQAPERWPLGGRGGRRAGTRGSRVAGPSPSGEKPVSRGERNALHPPSLR